MKKKTLALFIATMLIFTGCGKDSSSTEEKKNTKNEGETSVIDEAEMFTERDYQTEYDVSKSVSVELNGSSAKCESDTVAISGTTVIISEEGTYIFSGTLDDGRIVVDAKEKDKIQIILNGASITSATSAPLYILEADKVFVTLAEGTENTLANGGAFTAIDDNNIDGSVFSKQDLTFNGLGSLTITSPAGHGVVCKEDLVFTGGSYTVNSASHGMDANDSVRITKADVAVVSGKDGIHAENSDDTSLGFVYVADGSLNISAEGDGVSAGAYMQIKDGTFDIVSGGGSKNAEKQTSDSWGDFMGGGMKGDMGGGRPGIGRTQPQSQTTATETEDSTSIKGIKTTGDLVIAGGIFNVDSADDAIHSNTSISVNGGTFEIASGDDGFHADDTFTICDGTINITESYEGLEALDIKVSGGDIKLVANDDGLNAAGGTDSSGKEGPRGGDQFGGGRRGGPGGMSASSNGSIVISGGNLYVNALGDGIDANGTLEITGGYTVVAGPTRGDTATLDYDTGAVIKGGTFIGTGASGMAQTFSDSEQGVIAVSVRNQSAGTKVALIDGDGKKLISYEPELDFEIVILSSPAMEKGESYTLMIGEFSEEIQAN